MIKLYNYATHQENTYYDETLINKIKSICIEELKEVKNPYMFLAKQILEEIENEQR